MARECRPGATKAVDALLEWVYGKNQGWFYSHLSGFVHSSTYAMIQGTEVVEDLGGVGRLAVRM